MGFLITMFGSVMNYGKLIIGGLASVAVLFGWYKYKSKESEITDLKKSAENKDKEMNAIQANIKVQAETHKQELNNVHLQAKVNAKDTETEKKYQAKKDKVTKKIEDCVDNKPFDLEA